MGLVLSLSSATMGGTDGTAGRPTAQIVLSDEEREVLERWARRPKSAQALALRCRIVLAAAEGSTNQEIAAELGCHPTTVGKWRTPVRGVARRWVAGRATAGQAAHDQRRRRRAGDRQDAGGDPARTRRTGRRGRWPQATGMSQTGDPADLGCVRVEAASHRQLQAVTGPAVHRQGPRHRRAVPEPAGCGGRVVRRREVPDPSAGPHRTGAGRCCPACPSGAPTTTAATAPPTSTPPSTSPPARSSRR